MISRAFRPAAGLRRLLARFVGDARAAIAVEFAFAAPILAGMVLGVADYGRYVLLNQKLHRTSTTLADLVAREDQLSVADFAGIFAAGEHLMAPFKLDDAGVLVLTIVQVDDEGVARIVVRQQSPETSSYSGHYGNVGSVFSGGPEDLLIDPGDILVVAEARLEHRSWMVDLLNERGDLHHVSYFRPRGNFSLFLETP